jgi:hypothetical protein
MCASIVCLRRCLCLHVSVDVCVCVCVCTCQYLRLCLWCTHVYVSWHVRMYVPIIMHTHTRTHKRTHTLLPLTHECPPRPLPPIPPRTALPDAQYPGRL